MTCDRLEFSIIPGRLLFGRRAEARSAASLALTISKFGFGKGDSAFSKTSTSHAAFPVRTISGTNPASASADAPGRPSSTTASAREAGRSTSPVSV